MMYLKRWRDAANGDSVRVKEYLAFAQNQQRSEERMRKRNDELNKQEQEQEMQMESY